MNVLLLCSGNDEIFYEKGFSYPKNLVEINGKPVIQHVIENVKRELGEEDRFILAIKKSEDSRYHTATVARLVQKEVNIITVSDSTKGAVCTALLAVSKIENKEDLLIINGDIILDTSIKKAVEYFKNKGADGGAITFHSVHPRWSYVKCNQDREIMEAAEKRPISTHATAGIYYFRTGHNFVEAAMASIRKDANVNGNYYVCPVFNEMILAQKKLFAYEIENKSYHSLSTPDGVMQYQKFVSGNLSF